MMNTGYARQLKPNSTTTSLGFGVKLGTLLFFGFVGTGAIADTQFFTLGDFSQSVTLADCTSAEPCTKKLRVSASQSFQMMHWSYTELEERLTAFGVANAVLDAEWQEPDETDVVIKVNGTPVATEKFTKDCVRCKKRRRNPKDSANKVYSYALPGDVVTFEFATIETPISTANFTFNVKRYAGEALTESRSSAWFVPGFNNEGGDTHGQ